MNILLVDDNVYVLEGLLAGIDYPSLGIGQVFTAKSMQEAVELLETEEIPLVLTDIEMPDGSGLELLEWINENEPATVTIFCTSFADFDYAKRAVELHSFDYYLKPVRYDELQQLLKRAADEVHTRMQTKKKAFYSELWMSSISLRKRHFWEDVLLKIDSYDEDELDFLAQQSHLPYSKSSCFTLALLCFQKEQSKMEGFSEKLERFVMCNITEELSEPAGVCIETMVKCRRDTWLLVLSHGADMEKETVVEMFSRIVETLNRTIRCPVSGCFAWGNTLSGIRSRYMDLEMVSRECTGRESSVTDVDLFVKHGQEQAEDAARNEQAVRQIREYIDLHFCNTITAEELSVAVHFSPGYLAKLFRQKYGVSLGAYVIERRMEVAKRLLGETDIAISEVSVRSGYDNFAYFSRLFRRKTGMSPREFRAKAEKQKG